MDDSGDVLPRYMITRSYPTRRSKHETIRPTDRLTADLSAYGDHERWTGSRCHSRPRLVHQLRIRPGYWTFGGCYVGGRHRWGQQWSGQWTDGHRCRYPDRRRQDLSRRPDGD